MGIKLDISVETPLSDDDRDILAGISVMVLAIANRQNLVGQTQVQDEDELEGVEPAPCGRLAEQGRAGPLLHPRGRPLRSPHVQARQRVGELGVATSHLR